jgi:hypothetical protein
VNKIEKMQHFITLSNVACESFKTFHTNLAWQSNKAVTGGGEFFHKDRRLREMD